MDTFEKLDKVDLQILRTLQENARLTTKELAARVSLSSTPVFERLKRLESGGYIKKYIAVLDAEKLNQGFVVFCSVKLRRLNRDIAAEFTRIIQDIPEVTECYNISGSYDYLLKIHAPNMKYYQEFICISCRHGPCILRIGRGGPVYHCNQEWLYLISVINWCPGCHCL